MTLKHSKLHNTMLVATKVHVMLRSFVVLTWMRDKRRFNVACDIMEQHKTNVAITTITTTMTNTMHASAWFELFGGLFECQKPAIRGREKHDNNEWRVKLIPSPHMLVLATSEQFLLAGGSFRAILAQ